MGFITVPIVDRYDRSAEAWKAHDPEAVMAEFADAGTLAETAPDGTLGGEEIQGWVEEAVEAFPGIHFGTGRSLVNEEGLLFSEWTVYCTHDGPLQGLPPTHRQVEAGGVDVVTRVVYR